MTPNDILEDVFSPLTLDQFAAELWEKKTHYIPRENRSHYAKYFSLDGFETLLRDGRFEPKEVRVVSKGNPPAENYLDEKGRIDPERLATYRSEGYSVVLHGIQNFAQGAAELVSALSYMLSARVNANAYYTPAKTQALRPHYDTHDVIVVQISGSKDWRLYESAMSCPLDGTIQPPFDPKALPEPERLTLKPGDFLYVPRGYIHDASATDEHSLHITLGVHPTQWVDFLSTTLYARALHQTGLRRALPLGFLNRLDLLPQLQAQAESLLKEALPEISAEASFSITQDKFLREQQGVGVPGQHTSAAISETSTVRKKLGGYSRVIYARDEVALQFRDKFIACPRQFEPALQYIVATHHPFHVEDLPDLAREKKVNLANRLVDEGLLDLVA